MNERPKIIQLSEHVTAAVTFGADWQRVDLRTDKRQAITYCILRVIGRGPIETAYGVAVCSPRDYASNRAGQIVAMTRAVEDLIGEDTRACRGMVRRWFWEQDQAAQVPASSIPVEA